jgi:hypothetical protein
MVIGDGNRIEPLFAARPNKRCRVFEPFFLLYTRRARPLTISGTMYLKIATMVMGTFVTGACKFTRHPSISKTGSERSSSLKS